MSLSREPNALLNKSKLQKIDEPLRFTVFGYVRQEQNTYKSLQIIQTLIPFIVLAFYADIKIFKSPDAIRKAIADAINKQCIIWISYNGHQKPFIQRAIKPMSWSEMIQFQSFLYMN